MECDINYYILCKYQGKNVKKKHCNIINDMVVKQKENTHFP